MLENDIQDPLLDSKTYESSLSSYQTHFKIEDLPTFDMGERDSIVIKILKPGNI